jgi:hypothetical protein
VASSRENQQRLAISLAKEVWESNVGREQQALLVKHWRPEMGEGELQEAWWRTIHTAMGEVVGESDISFPVRAAALEILVNKSLQVLSGGSMQGLGAYLPAPGPGRAGKEFNIDADGIERDMTLPADRKAFFASHLREVETPEDRRRFFQEFFRAEVETHERVSRRRPQPPPPGATNTEAALETLRLAEEALAAGECLPAFSLASNYAAHVLNAMLQREPQMDSKLAVELDNRAAKIRAACLKE